MYLCMMHCNDISGTRGYVPGSAGDMLDTCDRTAVRRRGQYSVGSGFCSPALDSAALRRITASQGLFLFNVTLYSTVFVSLSNMDGLQ